MYPMYHVLTIGKNYYTDFVAMFMVKMCLNDCFDGKKWIKSMASFFGKVIPKIARRHSGT